MRPIESAETPTITREPVVPEMPPAGRALSRALRFEYLKLRGLRSTWIVLAVLAGFSLLNGVLLPTESTSPEGGGRKFLEVARLVDTLEFNPTAMQLPMTAWLLVFTLGTGSVTSEFGYRLARTTWLTVGSRRDAYVAKLIVGATGALVATGLSLALSAATGAVSLAVVGVTPPDWAAALAPLLRYLLVMACLPVLAAGLAALVRGRVASALALSLWPLFVERIVGFALERIPGAGDVSSWLPFAAARAAMNGAGTADDFTMALIGSDLSPGVALSVFCTYTLVIAGCGWLVYQRREAP
ncbi:hypothetical protein ACFY12_14990 [Streptomyces sp. NPDC001339]|uniref:hypothetical protein n=1 Tax=Streptomyces sp. NPDC001339 TaxID=3364563 RepID=UPI0036CB93CD